jgi:hypothetical protein
VAIVGSRVIAILFNGTPGGDCEGVACRLHLIPLS